MVLKKKSMNESYDSIVRTYKEFYRFLLKKGKLPMKDTKKGFWSPAPPEELLEVFRKIALHKNKTFLDLGSGDGIVVMIASLFTEATGIEHDSWLHQVSLDIRQKLSHLPLNRTIFINSDFMDHDLSSFDIVYINPDKPLYRGIEQKLMKELSGILVVHGHHFHPNNLKKIKSFDVGITRIGVYKR